LARQQDKLVQELKGLNAEKDGGYSDLVNKYRGAEGYSYLFNGQVGYLDHVLASTSLTAQVTGADEWHINSDEPDVLDYNTEYKSAGQVTRLYNADPYRSTDHDPVIVGVDLTPLLALTLSRFTVAGAAGAGWPAAAGLGALGIVLLAWRRRK
jgi:uncharacterized protein